MVAFAHSTLAGLAPGSLFIPVTTGTFTGQKLTAGPAIQSAGGYIFFIGFSFHG